MKIYDISQEVFSCAVYPGDTAPTMQRVRGTAMGDLYNLTDFSMCAHNGTHIDAPFHFLADGKTVEQLPLQKAVGLSSVISYDGEMSAVDAADILSRTQAVSPTAARKLLFKGNTIVTPEAAKVFAAAELDLLGVESQSVGEASRPMEVHKLLLSHEILLLEGIRLGEVHDGVYFLSAAPLSLAGADGAPCRAFLMEANSI